MQRLVRAGAMATGVAAVLTLILLAGALGSSQSARTVAGTFSIAWLLVWPVGLVAALWSDLRGAIAGWILRKGAPSPEPSGPARPWVRRLAFAGAELWIASAIAIVALVATAARTPRRATDDFEGRPRTEWFEMMRHPNLNYRFGAAQVLVRMGPDAAPAVPIVVETLRADPDAEVRDWAAKALGAIGPAARPAVPLLIERFAAQPDSATIGEALVGIGTASVEPLQRMLQSADGPAETRWRAASLLRKIGSDARPALPALRAALDGEPQLAGEAASALLAIDPGMPPGDVMPQVVAVLRASDWRVQQDVLETIRGLPPDRRSALLPDLVSALRTSTHENAGHLPYAVALLGADAGPAVPLLIAVLPSDGAFYAFGEIGPAAAPAVPYLVKTCLTLGGRTELAARSLGRIGVAEGGVVEALIVVLGRDGGGAREEAVRALGLLGPPARPAVPALLEIASREQGRLLPEAAGALGRIDREAAASILPRLRATVRDTRWPEGTSEPAIWAVKAMGRLGALAGEAAPDLAEDIGAHRPWRQAALVALGRIGSEAEARALLPRFLEGDQFDRESAACLLGETGGEGDREVLRGLARDHVEAVRETARRALERLEGRDDRRIPLCS